MGRRWMQGDRAFEAYLRARRIPYLSVDEAKRTLLPAGRDPESGEEARQGAGLKSFDFLVSGWRGGRRVNLLIDVKGRRATARGALPNWVTRDDVDSLERWRGVLGAGIGDSAFGGAGFEPGFVFVYHGEEAFPAGRFEERFTCGGVFYALRAARLEDYRARMRTRSPRWGTVDLSAADFERISGPFCPAGVGAGEDGAGVRPAGAVEAA